MVGNLQLVSTNARSLRNDATLKWTLEWLELSHRQLTRRAPCIHIRVGCARSLSQCWEVHLHRTSRHLDSCACLHGLILNCSCRGVLTRPELSLCLLAEVAYEHDEVFRAHLPLVLHTTMLEMDSAEPLVFRHAQIMLIHLLFSLSAQHLEVQQSAGKGIRCPFPLCV